LMYVSMCCLMIYFIMQAEDGIRDRNVTGVQTCALPISEVDILTLAVPNDVHKDLAIRAMAAGKNVISEKPVTLSSADLQEMIDASEKYGKLFTVHQNRRWDEDFLAMKEVYESGKLGYVFNIESRVHGSRGIPGDWRQRKAH